MATQSDVRRISLSFPETVEEMDRFAFSVRNGKKAKAFVWAWMERVEPGAPRVGRPDVVAIRVDRHEKQELLDSDDEKFFTEPHYNNYPAILVRLPNIDVAELRELLTDAWRIQAPRKLAAAFEVTARA
jgi:hypothetical protein